MPRNEKVPSPLKGEGKISKGNFLLTNVFIYKRRLFYQSRLKVGMVSNIPNITMQNANLANLYPNLKDSSISIPVIPPPVQEGDSTHFTSKQKSNDQSFVQKHWGKMLLGAAAITVGAILTKGKLWAKEKPVSFEKVQQNFAEIFGKKNLTKEETEAMLKKYQEIYKIKDKKEFINQAFNQMKKDFGYENIPYELEITKKLSFVNGAIGLGVNASNKMTLYKFMSRKKILEAITHEFTHLRQREYGLRTSPQKLVEAMKKNIFNGLEHNPKAKKDYEKDIKMGDHLIAQKCIQELKDLGALFGKLPMFEKGSEKYLKGEKYIKAKSEQTDFLETNQLFSKTAYTKYRDNLLEQEAWQNGSLMQEIARYIEANK